MKVPVDESDPVLPSAYGVFKAADWFEREAWDMFGIRFDGHPNLRRLLTHEAFQGHPLRKDYDPGQRWLLTEAESMIPSWVDEPDDPDQDQFETQVLNLGPSHPATHGTLRTVIRLDGEIITRAECEIGYLHRCFEKMSETHGWNQVIPYTDRLNYCSSMMNGVGFALAVESMLGIEAPPRAQVDPGDPVRAVADHGPLRVPRRQPRRPRCAHQLLVLLPASRGDLRAARGLCGGPSDGVLRPGRRASRTTFPPISSSGSDTCSTTSPSSSTTSTGW